MRRLLIALALLFPAALAAQVSKDSLYAAHQKVDCQYVLSRDKSAPKYSKDRMQACIARMDSTLALHRSAPPPPVNQAPVARVASSCVDVTRICSVNGTASTDDKAIVSAVIRWGDGASTNGLTGTHTYSTAGTYNGSLTVTDAEGLTSSAPITLTLMAAAQDSVVAEDSAVTGVTAAQPKLITTDYPTTTGTTRNVAAGGDLQAALNASQTGDQIVLAAGATYTGNFQLPPKSCTGWIVVRSGAPDASYPAFGTRITPRYAPALAKIVTPNVAPALYATNGSCKWWFSRVEITGTAQSSTVNYNYGLVRIGDGETALAQQPTDIVLDRVYLHGTTTTSTQNGFVMNGRALALINSWVDQIKWPGTESHCVVGWQGQGPFKIANNYLNCASINILFGGAQPVIAGVHPSDIEISRNHITKDTTWRGKGLVIKNLVEMKDARRTLVTGNVIDRSWSDAQEGMAINAQTLTDERDPTTWTADLNVEWNIISNANTCFVFTAHGTNGAGIAMARAVVQQNLCTGIGGDGTNRAMLLGGELQGVRIQHNTFVRDRTPGGVAIYIDRAGQPAASRLDVLDNLIGPGLEYPCVFGEGRSGQAAMTFYATVWSFKGNACWESYGDGSVFPSGNVFAPSQSAVSFAADWSLGAGSPFKGKASDGTDPGVNVAELVRRTVGVVVSP